MYGESKNWRYLIGFGLVIILLFFIIFMIVRGGGSSEGKIPETKKELTSYADSSDAVVTSRLIGPITAAQDHYEVEINVSNSQATVDLISGYDGNVIDSRSYPLTTEAFREFLSALDKVGFTKGNTDEALRNDQGYCPTGQRYIFEMRDGANNIQRFWTTSCNGTKTYKGNRSATLNLFQKQIPDYNDFVNNSDLGSSGSFSL